MITLFTVDRRGNLANGKHPQLIKNVTGRPELDQHSSKLFPNGVSAHGNQYFMNATSSVMNNDCSIELHVEMHRRAFYPDKPSRFTSIFACRRLDECLDFRLKYGSPDHHIYSLLVDENFVHSGDMELLKSGCTTLVFSQHLDLYWRGADLREYVPNHRPFYEMLIDISKPSIHSISKVA